MAASSSERQPDSQSVFVLATLDTKRREGFYLRDALRGLGIDARLVDVSCSDDARAEGDVRRDELLALAGLPAGEFPSGADRGQAVTVMAAHAARWIADQHAAGHVAGVIALGGSAGTTIGTAAMRALPLGVPKLMISTLASGQVRHYVGDKDILMFNAVVDFSGLNRITTGVLDRAAAAMAGMINLSGRHQSGNDARPLIAATMFGVTTPCVEAAKAILESHGYEVIVFHATGSGGQAMESLIEEGLFCGVLDITTTELADELVGGVLSAGPERLTAAARLGVPQLVSVGATDMVNFHAPTSVPAKFAARRFHQHNANVTLMRTTAQECAAIGAEMAGKLSAARGPVRVLLPMRGVSALDGAGLPFDEPEARRALAVALAQGAPQLGVRELDLHINDPAFAEQAAAGLLELIETGARRTPST